MKIGILGLGVIGSACKYGFEKLGHKVFGYDPKIENTKFEDVLDTDIVYICVPTPSMDDGSCDVSIVTKSVIKLKEHNYKGIVAIKSTVRPTTTDDLWRTTGLNICFVPEFLRERCAIADFTENHNLLAVGTRSKEVFEVVKECHGIYPNNYVMLGPTEAELLKYYSNAFNAMKVIFANEMYEVCQASGADYSKIKSAFIKRRTAIDLYLDVNDNFRGYGGGCLPKDTLALATYIKELKLDLNLFDTINNENKKFKTTVFDGMRK